MTEQQQNVVLNLQELSRLLGSLQASLNKQIETLAKQT